MSPLTWVLLGAGIYFVLATFVGALVEFEIREALVRVLLAPVALLLGPLVWVALHVPTAGKFSTANLRRELDAHHHVARGAAYRTWAVLVIRRTGPKPPPAQRVP